MKFCVDCRFHEEGHLCGAVQDIVTGEVVHMPCKDARADPQCGPPGVMFKESDGTQNRRIERDRKERENRKLVRDPGDFLAVP